MARRGHQRILSQGRRGLRRTLGTLLLLAATLPAGGVVCAQQNPEPATATRGAASSSGSPAVASPPPPRPGASPDYKAAMDAPRIQPPRAFLDRLSPADREAFQRNLRLWRDLSPGEQNALRVQAEQGRAKRKAEAEHLLGESGLQLDTDRREVFILRYLQERRRLERELRQKMDAERARRLPEIAAVLKKEFSELPPDSSQSRGPQVPFMR